MAYSSMLALFPFILTLLTGVGLFVGSSEQAFERLMEQLSQIAPQEALALLDRYVRELRFGQKKCSAPLTRTGAVVPQLFGHPVGCFWSHGGGDDSFGSQP
jgi:membrane protein